MAWVTSSTSCPTTSASWVPTTRGGWTCSRTARPRASPSSSTSTGHRRIRRSLTSCSCRRWVSRTARSSNAASCSFATSLSSARSRCFISSIDFRSTRAPILWCWNARLRASRAHCPRLRELESLVSAFRNLPDRETATPEQIIERDRDEEFHKQRLRELLNATPEFQVAVEAAAAEISGEPGNPASFDAAARLARTPVLSTRLLACGSGRHQLSPLLRRQRPRSVAHGERRGVRVDAPAS